jgi:hypothetical protein
MLKIAFKEWAMVCQALAEGWQSLIIRKGGIAEEGGVFKPEYDRFWLYPTYFHQQAEGIKADYIPPLRKAMVDRPPEGIINLSHFAEVAAVHFVRSEEAALALEHHIWSPETIRQRFHYRTPGLYVLAVRVYERWVGAVGETPAYAGCKTWVHLDEALPTDGAKPVMSDEAFAMHLSWIRNNLAEADG